MGPGTTVNFQRSAGHRQYGRHYDTLLWTVAGILGAAIAGLLAYSYEQTCLSMGPPLLGAGLTLASVFFACSWRALRRGLNQFIQAQSPADLGYVLSHPLFKQWPVFLFLHIVLLWAWVRLLLVQHGSLACVWWALGIGGTLFILVWGIMADKLPLKRSGAK